MSEDGLPKGVVTRTELAVLASLFDRFEFAFDPPSISAKEAESEFDNYVRKLFDERVIPVHPRLSFPLFRCKIKSACRAFLRKNPPS